MVIFTGPANELVYMKVFTLYFKNLICSIFLHFFLIAQSHDIHFKVSHQPLFEKVNVILEIHQQT